MVLVGIGLSLSRFLCWNRLVSCTAWQTSSCQILSPASAQQHQQFSLFSLLASAASPACNSDCTFFILFYFFTHSPVKQVASFQFPCHATCRSWFLLSVLFTMGEKSSLHMVPSGPSGGKQNICSGYMHVQTWPTALNTRVWKRPSGQKHMFLWRQLNSTVHLCIVQPKVTVRAQIKLHLSVVSLMTSVICSVVFGVKCDAVFLWQCKLQPQTTAWVFHSK